MISEGGSQLKSGIIESMYQKNEREKGLEEYTIKKERGEKRERKRKYGYHPHLVPFK